MEIKLVKVYFDSKTPTYTFILVIQGKHDTNIWYAQIW